MRPGILACFSTTLERALRRASEWHEGQTRKGAHTPYIAHPFGVAMILERLGFGEDVVVAGLLHDVVEDTDATIEEIRDEFGPNVASLVASCSEVKCDEQGRKRAWVDRKRDYLEAVAASSVEARAVALADKLHNLTSLKFDLDSGRPMWEMFNAGRGEVLGYYRMCADRFGGGDPRLEPLSSACRAAIDLIEAMSEDVEKMPPRGSTPVEL
jgi:(p)ppGpp synthase/HD superfamily hydrolase